MAPAKPPPSNVGAKNIATSLSSPVSLLWAHQLRREHSALLARIEDLASAVSNVSLEQLKKIAAQATRVETKMSTIESKQVKLKKELDRAGDREGHLENDVSMVSDRLDISEESILALRKDVHTIEEQLKKDLVVIVERKLQQDNEEQERQVQELKAQIRDIQSRLPEIVSESVVGVRDSMEEIREQMNPIAERDLRPVNHVTDIGALHVSGLVQPNSNRTEGMLTLRPNLDTQAALCPPGDIDLGENMLTPEPDADNVRQTLPEETMAMIPESLITNFHQQKDSGLLKQGKFQSWDRYLTTGEALIGTLPKRKEGAFVEAFVDGIYDEKLRRNCETMLDEIGWSWESVKDFVMNYVFAEVETQARQRTKLLTHKHGKGEICPVCPQKVNYPQSVDMAVGIANSIPRKPLQESAQRPQTADPQRRSERIHQQSQPSSVRAKNVIKPKTPKARPAKSVDESQMMTQGTSEHEVLPKEARENVKTAKKKLTATKPGAATSTGDERVCMTPQGGMQQKTLELAQEDRGTWKDTKTAPDLRRNKNRRPLKETQPSVPPNFQPITPMNHTIQQGSPDLQTKTAKATTRAREDPEPKSSKKRKLVEQLEVPVTTKLDLVTPLDKETKQSEAKEPERKKRRKKRAVAPIPMIPILPLSDEE